jgi:hypothetical protein
MPGRSDSSGSFFSIGKKDKRALKGYLTQATLHDKGATEAA